MELDDKHEALKGEVHFQREIIEEADDRLRYIRDVECKHPETETCTHSPRPGQYFENTEICAVCGKVLNIPGLNDIK